MSCSVNIAGEQFTTEQILKSYLGAPERFDDVVLFAEDAGDFIAGLPIRHQLEMAETLIAFTLRDLNVFDSYDKDNKQKLNKQKLFEEFDKHKKTFVKDFEDAIKFAAKPIANENDKKIGQFAQTMLDNYDVFENLGMRVLINKGLFSLAQGDVDSLFDSLNENNFRHFNEDFQFERDLKDNMSERLKYFLAQIEAVDNLGQARKTIFGYPIYMDMDEVYVAVRTVLSGVYPDYTEMRALLVAESKHKPWLAEVVERLDKDESIRNEFVTNMTSHPVTMLFINPVEGADGITTWKITESNRNTGGRIVVETWEDSVLNNQNLYYQDPEDGYHRIIGSNTREEGVIFQGSAVISELMEKYKDKAATAGNMQQFFKDIGINLSEAAAKYIEENGFTMVNTEYTLESFMRPRNNNYGTAKILEDLRYLSIDNKAYEEANIFDSMYSGSLLRAIAEIEFKVSKNTVLSSFRTGDKSIAAHILNRYATNRVRDLINNPNLRAELKAMAFNNSSLLDMLEDPILQKDFFLNYPDISNILGGTYEKELRDLTPEEHMTVAMILHQNNGYILKNSFKKSYRSAKMFYPTMSDKKNKFIISTPLEIVNEYKFFEGENIHQAVIEHIVSALVMPEYRRIFVEQNVGNRNISGYDEGKSNFFIFPELNNVEDLFYTDNGQKKIIDPKLLSPEAKDAIYKIVGNHLQREFSEMKSRFGENFAENMNPAYSSMLGEFGVKDNKVDTAILDFILSSLVTNMNVMQLISGDPAMMFKKNINKSWDNYAKRWAKDNAPGLEIDDTADSLGNRNKYKVLFVKDIKDKSEYLSHFKQLDAEDGYGEDEDGVGEMNTADAQAYISLKEWAHILFRKGDITFNENKTLIEAYEKDLDIDPKLLKRIVNVFKPVVVTDKRINGVEQKIYIKMSTFPLIPQLTRGTELEDVRIKMKTAEVDMIATKSASKLGAPTILADMFADEAYSADSIIDLDRYGFRLQQELPQKDKNFINRGTQFTKLLFSGVRHIEGMAQLESEYDALYAELYNKKQEELGKEILNDDLSLNFDKLNEIIKKELIERKYDSGTLKYFERVMLNGKSDFAYPFPNNPQKNRIEAVINSLIDSRIRKVKFPGKSYVLASRAGFKTKAVTLEEYQKSGGGIVFTPSYEFGSNLKPQVFNKDAQQRAQVIVPWNFRDDKGQLLPMKNYMTDGQIDFDKLPKELLQIQGFRIPTQGLNSMSAVEIVGFLPEGITEIVIAPAEYVTQMGSDFDVDKLYTYQKNYSVRGKEIKVTTREEDLELGILNEIIDIHDKVLTNPDPEVQKAIVKKLSFGKFEEEDFFDKLGVQEGTKRVFIMPSQQMENYIGASSAKDAVGAYSLASTFNSLIQDVSGNKSLELEWDLDVLGIYGKDENFNKALRTFGKVKASNNLSTTQVADSKSNRSKGDVIAAIQSAAVDNENERILERIGVTGNTMRIPPAMAQLGFEEDVFSTLLKMPLVVQNGEWLKMNRTDFADTMTNALLRKFTSSVLKDFRKGYIDEKTFEILRAKAIEDGFNTLKEVVEAPISDYQKALRGEDVANAELFEYAAMYQLYSFNNLGKILGEYQQLLNIDSAGLKKNFLEAIVYDTKFQDMLQRNDPILPFIGEFVSSPEEGGLYKLDDKKYFKPNKISSIIYFNESRFIVDTLYSDSRLTMYKTKAFEKIRDEILALALEKNPHDVRMGELLAFYESHINTLDSALTKYMLSGVSSLFPDGMISFKLKMPMLEEQVRKLQKSKSANGNKFLALLTNNKDGKITYRASRKSDDFSSTIHDFVNDLFVNDRYLEEIGRNSKDFVLDLIRYNYIEDPFQRATNFSRHIPFKILKNIGIPEALRLYDLNDEASLGYNPQQISAFTRQFLQNNPSLVPNYSKRVKYDPSKSTQETLIFESSGQGLNPADPRIIKLGEFLYQSTGKRFVRIPQLYNEYDIKQTVISQSRVNPASTKSDFKHEHYEPVAPKVKLLFQDKMVKAIEKNDISEVLRLISQDTLDPSLATLAEEFLNNPLLKDVIISFAKVPLGRTSYLSNFNLITVNKSRFATQSPNKQKIIILHELVHAFTKKAIIAYRTSPDSLSPEQKKAMDKINALYDFFSNKTVTKAQKDAFENKKKEAEKKGEPFNPTKEEANIVYATKNLEEFMAILMTTPELQEHLKANFAGKKTLWEKIKDAIFELLKAFNLVSEEAEKIVELAMEEVLTVIKTNDDIIVPSIAKSGIFASIKDITPDNPLLDIC